MGRPPLINEAYHDVQEPLNVSLDAIRHGQSIPVLPMSVLTSGTVFILRTRLSALTGRIAHHFQKLHEPAQYQEVERLDAEISRFIDSLPPVGNMSLASISPLTCSSVDSTFALKTPTPAWTSKSFTCSLSATR